MVQMLNVGPTCNRHFPSFRTKKKDELNEIILYDNGLRRTNHDAMCLSDFSDVSRHHLSYLGCVPFCVLLQSSNLLL